MRFSGGLLILPALVSYSALFGSMGVYEGPVCRETNLKVIPAPNDSSYTGILRGGQDTLYLIATEYNPDIPEDFVVEDDTFLKNLTVNQGRLASVKIMTKINYEPFYLTIATQHLPYFCSEQTGKEKAHRKKKHFWLAGGPILIPLAAALALLLLISLVTPG